MMLCWAANGSDGALDNATGLASLLAIAERAEGAEDIGFLVTDAEEMALAGAYAVAPDLPPVAGIINIDGVDDDGAFHLVEQHGFPRRGRAPHLAAALLASADVLGAEARRRDLPPGLMVEHVAYVGAGIPSLTLMRGGLGSLTRVHRPGDKARRIHGDGVALTAAVVDGALALLRSARPPERSRPLLRGRSEDLDTVRPPSDVESTPLLGHRRSGEG